MSYVIYNIHTTMMHRKRGRSWGTWVETWGNKGAATRELNRAIREGILDEEEYAIAEKADFHKNIELQVEKTMPGTGEKVTMAANTPACCDPTTETYWCM